VARKDGSLGCWAVGRLGGGEAGRLRLVGRSGCREAGMLGGWETGRLGGGEAGMSGRLGGWEAGIKGCRDLLRVGSFVVVGIQQSDTGVVAVPVRGLVGREDRQLAFRGRSAGDRDSAAPVPYGPGSARGRCDPAAPPRTPSPRDDHGDDQNDVVFFVAFPWNCHVDDDREDSSTSGSNSNRRSLRIIAAATATAAPRCGCATQR
jgi:hypothetical protein